MRKKIYRQITSWLLILCISFTSCEWSSVAWAAGNDVKNDTEQTTEEAQDPDAVEEFEDSGEIDTDLADPEELEKEEIVEERTPNSTTWQLSDGRKMTEFYSSDVRYEDEEGSLVDYDTSLIAVDSELTVKGEELEGYAYVNAQGDMKHYIPEEIGQETPLRMENGEYSLEVTPLFGQSGEAYEIDISADMISAEEGSVSTDAEPPADMGLSILGSEDNAFREIEELSSVQVEEEKTTDIYGEEEEKNTAAVYTSEDESFELEYVPFETGVKENIILNEKPESNVWQFALTLGGGITARKNAVTQGISFYALGEKEEEVLVGGIQTPYMNDATEEHYSEAITYDLEEADGSEGTYILTMTVDPDYLEDEDTVYPVTIDPSYTWTGGSAVYDVYVLSKSTYADMNFYDSSTTGMFAGRTNANGYERTYIAFNGLANKVSGYSVASAKLTIYETGGGTAGETVQAHTVTAAWDKSTLTWNNRPSYSGTVLSSFTNTAESYHAGTLDITSYARKVANGSSDYGIMLRTKDEAVSQYAKFYGSRHSSTSYRPKLVVTYYDKPTTASSVKLASAYLKKGASVTVTWEGIESVALSKVQYRIASITDDGKAFINTELAPYASNPSLGNTASGTGTIDTSTFGEGYFRLYVRGMDKYGSVGTGKATNFILDSTVPTLSSASLTPATSTTSYSSNLTPVINWSGAADRFFKKVQYSVDGTSYTQIGTTESGSFTVPSGKITTSGKHTIKVRAVDKCSNASTAKTLYYYCDITKPTGSITVQDADGDDSGKYQITLAASDANSGVRSVTLKLSGETLDSDETLYSGTAGSSVIFDPSEYPEGTYTLTLTVTDKCGNNAAVTKTFSPIDLADWAPQNLTVQDKINYKTLLKWDRRGEDALPDSISYEVYRSTSADFTPDESTLAASGLKTCYWCEPNVNYGKTYYYKVRAVRSNSSGTVTATGSFSAEVSSTVVSADEYEKFLGIKDYWGYQSLETPVGTGQVEESKGNFVYQQEDVTLPSSELAFGILRTYNSQSTAKTAFGNGWDHNFNLEILRVCDSNGEDTDSYVFKDGTGTIEKLKLQEDGSYLSGSTKELQLFESGETEGTLLELDEVHQVTWSYRMEDKSQTCWYFNSSGQAIAITEPTGTWILLHYDEKQGMLSQVEASTGKVLDFEYQDASDGDHVLVKEDRPAG